MANARSLLLGLVRSRSTFLLGIGNRVSLRPMHSLLPVAYYGIASSYKPLLGFRCFSSAGPHVVLEMPALSPTMNQGNIAKWIKQEGDKINVGDVLCEIETDKATLEFESLEEGYLAKILAPEGSKDVPVGQPIAITVEDPDELKNVPAEISKKSEVKEEKSTQAVAHKGSSERSNFSRISPSAKLLITEHGLEASSLKASGPRGTLLKGDVLEAIKSGRGSRQASTLSQEKPSPSTNGTRSMTESLPQSSTASAIMDTYDDLPNTQIRKVIAKRLVESKQNTPHLYLSSDVVLDPLLAFRKELKDQHNVKVSVNDIVIKAVAIALKNVPEANDRARSLRIMTAGAHTCFTKTGKPCAFWNAEKGEASLWDSIDISIAVATEKGLMTPIIRNAYQKSLSTISSEVKELAEKARAGKLAPHQFQGGTFSISNLGMFPVDHFCAIINPPQACILAVGRGNKVVEPVTGSDGMEKPAVVTKMTLKLSADHRVFDGGVGGKFLSTLALNFSDIRRLLL